MGIRLNGNYIVQYGTIIPDHVKHEDGDGYVLTVQLAPFCDGNVASAWQTAEDIINSGKHGHVVWWNVVEVATGETISSQVVDIEKYRVLTNAGV